MMRMMMFIVMIMIRKEEGGRQIRKRKEHAHDDEGSIQIFTTMKTMALTATTFACTVFMHTRIHVAMSTLRSLWPLGVCV